MANHSVIENFKNFILHTIRCRFVKSSISSIIQLFYCWHCSNCSCLLWNDCPPGVAHLVDSRFEEGSSGCRNVNSKRKRLYYRWNRWLIKLLLQHMRIFKDKRDWL